ncbi:alpha/beta hydrolase [Mycoplasmopsis columbina]|uniref:alpha/beta hydrolase n=1 Tax=Mycoplasmopsis columbina TaxID=114881 RepID=UPI00055F140E|nr:alpha/beta hydrolase [Mycoplasmopsis columbina]
MKLNYIKVKNYIIPIYYKNNKSDTTFLFLHGINSSSDFCLPIAQKNQKYNIVAINFPGNKYFENVSPENITLEWWTEAAQAVLKEIKSKKIVVVAHSMGGGVALNIGKDKRIKRLIMVATIHPFMVINNGYSILQKVIKPISTTHKLIGETISKISSKFKKTQRLSESFSREGNWYNLLEKYILNDEYMKKLKVQYEELKDKIIFVVGENDPIVGTKSLMDFANQIDTFVTIIGKSHSPIKDDPQKFAYLFDSLEKPEKKKIWTKVVTFEKKVKNFESRVIRINKYKNYENLEENNYEL